MTEDKAGLSTFLTWILGELSLLGKFAAFFGILLLLSGIAWPDPTRLLAGFALVCLALAEHYWTDRHTAHWDPDEPVPWCKRFLWAHCVLALAFFMAFVITGYAWLRLKPVRQFMESAGLPFFTVASRPSK